jgi:hypothetical protein
MFVLFVGHWRILHFLDPCIVVYLPNKVFIKQVYHNAQSRKWDTSISYSIYDPLWSIGIHTNFLSWHPSRREEPFFLCWDLCPGRKCSSVWLVSCADRHCLMIGWSPWVAQEKVDKGNHQHHCQESSSFIRALAHAGMQLLIRSTIIVMHCTVQQDTGNGIVQVLVVPSIVLSAPHSIHTITVANRIRDHLN